MTRVAAPIKEFVAELEHRQLKNGAWNGVFISELPNAKRRNAVIYTSQILRACAAVGLNEYEVVARGVRFLDECDDRSSLYDIALKFHPFWELGLKPRAMELANDIASLVPDSGNVQFSSRADHVTFEHLLTAEILLTALTGEQSHSGRIKTALERVSRFIHTLHLEQLEIADDPSHWLWAAVIMQESGIPVSDKRIRGVLDKIRILRGNSPLWKSPSFRKFNSLAPATQTDEVITCHIIMGIARLKGFLLQSDIDDLVVTPLRSLVSTRIDNVWKGRVPNVGEGVEDLYVHCLSYRTAVLASRLLGLSELSQLLVSNTGLDVEEFWLSSVVARDMCGNGDDEKNRAAVLELLKVLYHSIATQDQKIDQLIEATTNGGDKQSIEFTLPIIPTILKYKFERTISD